MHRCAIVIPAAAIFAMSVALAQQTAQQAAQPLRFEVASIKPSSPDAHGSSMMTDRAGGLNVENAPLRALITSAYGIRDFQLSGGPGWIGTDRYDIIAKAERAESAAEPPELRTMTEEQLKDA